MTMSHQHGKAYHSREVVQGKQENTPETAALGESPVSLVCAGSLPDGGLKVLTDDQQSARG